MFCFEFTKYLFDCILKQRCELWQVHRRETSPGDMQNRLQQFRNITVWLLGEPPFPSLLQLLHIDARICPASWHYWLRLCLHRGEKFKNSKSFTKMAWACTLDTHKFLIKACSDMVRCFIYLEKNITNIYIYIYICKGGTIPITKCKANNTDRCVMPNTTGAHARLHLLVGHHRI